MCVCVCACVRVCVRENEREAPDCAVRLCAAGLVCMKSSTSVVELVMLLCSQVGNSSPLASVLTLMIHIVTSFLTRGGNDTHIFSSSKSTDSTSFNQPFLQSLLNLMSYLYHSKSV